MRTWTQEQEELLKNVYVDSTNSELAKMFPGKTLLAIYKKARKFGFYKSKEVEFLNRSEARKLPNENHKKSKTKKGYVMVYRPNHERSDKNGRVMEHIVVFEESTGIKVPRNCVIHHLNGDKSDNRIENLCMMEIGAHTVFHHYGKHKSDDCKKKIGEKTRKRLQDPRNHPMWKEVDMNPILSDIANGTSVKDACEKYGISKTIYYKRLRCIKNES